MSAQSDIKRLTVPQLRARKGEVPIVSLTAYTTPVARLLDPHVDVLLVGDSLGMVVYGLDSTLGVTLEMMIAHGQAVMRGSQRACVVVDMPFGSYQESPQTAFRAAARLLAETGVQAVKLEGGAEMAETIAFLTARGVPVMGHVGLTPQSVNVLGGFRTQGRDEGTARRVLTDAEAVAAAGAFAVVVEGTVESLAREITTRIPIPTIGIGASPYCDGQVLVVDDVLGIFTDFTPKFVRRYAELGPQIGAAAAAFATDVRNRRFPGPEHCVGVPPPPRVRPVGERPRGEGP
jgi:3-methyl-2-oxobutanoate hydroxymethyltransferase